MGVGAGEPRPAAAGGSNEQAAALPVVDAAVDVGDVLNKVGLKKKDEKTKWNTQNLGRRLAVDAMCAITAGGLVAPIITMVDKYVRSIGVWILEGSV